MPERRLHPRGRIEASVDYDGTDGISCQGLEDVSLGGVRLLLSAPETPGTEVRVHVRFASLEPIAFEALGRVVWARQNYPFLVGIRWLNDQAAQSLSLKNHITAWGTPRSPGGYPA